MAISTWLTWLIGLILAGVIFYLLGWIIWGIVGLILAAVVWWLVPIYLVEGLDITESKDRADTIDNYRKTIGQAFAAFALIVTFAWTMYKDRETIDLSRFQFRTQQANQQFISAAQLLKETSVSTRIAGLYAIEQIATSKLGEGYSQTTEENSEGTSRDSKEQAKGNLYLTPAIRAAIGFIKSSDGHAKDASTAERPTVNPVLAVPVDLTTCSRTQNSAKNAPPIEHPISADTQSAIEILARMNRAGKVTVDLRRSYLVRAQFTETSSKAFVGAHFDAAKLYGAYMGGGLDLTGAAFGGSFMADWEAYGPEDWEWVKDNREFYDQTRAEHVVNFSNSTLRSAGFQNMNMAGAILDDACLQGAEFYHVDLSRASLQRAKLGGADEKCAGEKKAHFYKSVLIDADFSEVDVGDVNFDCTILSGANFETALNVDKASFKNACTDQKPIFPASFTTTFPTCDKRPPLCY
jgi:uncharacterized protein YjbI with pentapeptide repeats